MYNSYRKPVTPFMFFGVIGGFVLVILIGWYAVAYNTTHTKTITVCSKERAATDNGAEYRIYAYEGTYVMADSLFGKTRYSTADAYAKVQSRTTYDVVFKGFRVPFLSMFPNLLELEKSTEQHPELCEEFG